MEHSFFQIPFPGRNDESGEHLSHSGAGQLESTNEGSEFSDDKIRMVDQPLMDAKKNDIPAQS